LTALVTLANRMLLEQRRQFSSQGTESSTSSTDSTKNKGLGRMRIDVPNYGPDADKAVKSLQNARKERARAKTAANVRRALYGNSIICVAKFGAWFSSGSSSMMAEFVHSVVDCANQSLLLMGLRDSRNAADRLHPYGYGKSIYFWALVSALGTFFLGAGLSMSHSVGELMNPSLQNITNEVWGVLALSFTVDGYVLYKTITEIQLEKPDNVPFWDYVSKLRDPATLAVLLEDGAACLGIAIAIAGITASHTTAMPIFDGAAGVGISVLLGSMGLALVRVNHRFLLGQGVDKEMTDEIEKIIKARRSIDNVYSIQSQWTGPETFSFKAEVDFDGTYLAAQLMPRYQGEFEKAREDFDQELPLLLCWYAEDVIRAVEREVRHIEAIIRQRYPGAEYIELEPMSKDADRFAIDDSFEEKLLVIEREEMQRLTRVLYQNNEAKNPSKTGEAAIKFSRDSDARFEQPLNPSDKQEPEKP
jgi:zinc transporter 9